MVVRRQDHCIVSEVAALGTKSGWGLYRKDLYAICWHTSSFWLLDTFLLSSCDIEKKSRAACCVCQRRHQAERPYAQVHQPLCYGQGCFNSGSAGGLFWHLYNGYICSGGSGSVALLFLDRKIKNQSRSEIDEAQLFDFH